MNGENKNTMGCSEFDLLLTEAMDGQLTGEQLARFEQHKSSCASCAAMFADVQAGFNWLGQVEDVEPPRHLMHNILVATSGVTEVTTAKARPQVKRSTEGRLRELFGPVFAPIFTSRFAMSAAMAFFSVTLALNVGGIKVSQLDLSPRGITRSYYATEARAVKYYENIRLVYEIESRVKDLQRATGSGNESGEPKQQQNDNNKTNKESEPERRQENYSQRNEELREANLDGFGIGIIARQRRLS